MYMVLIIYCFKYIYKEKRKIRQRRKKINTKIKLTENSALIHRVC